MDRRQAMQRRVGRSGSVWALPVGLVLWPALFIARVLGLWAVPSLSSGMTPTPGMVALIWCFGTVLLVGLILATRRRHRTAPARPEEVTDGVRSPPGRWIRTR